MFIHILGIVQTCWLGVKLKLKEMLVDAKIQLIDIFWHQQNTYLAINLTLGNFKNLNITFVMVFDICMNLNA